MTKSLILGILLSTAVRAVLVAKLVILVILPLTSFILALRAELVAQVVILGISPVTSFILGLGAVLVAYLLSLVYCSKYLLSQHYISF